MKIDFKEEGAKGRYLRAGLHLFSTRGYESVSVRDIAAESGASVAALYRHFESKEAMALYLFRYILSRYEEGLREIAHHETSAVEKLIAFQDYTYRFYAEDPDSVRFGLLSQHHFWDEVEDELKPHFWLRNVLEEGMERGEIQKKPVYLWITLYTGLLLEPLIQYPYFSQALPQWTLFSEEVGFAIRHLLSEKRD